MKLHLCKSEILPDGDDFFLNVNPLRSSILTKIYNNQMATFSDYIGMAQQQRLSRCPMEPVLGADFLYYVCAL
jgi:hypothetical protein